MNEVKQSTELVELVEGSGLEQTKQNNVAKALGEFFAEATKWNETIQSIVITSPDEVGKMKMAKEGRITLKNMRLKGEKVVAAKRQEVKYRMADDVLEDTLWRKAGQMMEATFKNLEGKLEEKETFKIRYEANERAKLKEAREEELEPYAEFVPFGTDLAFMDEEGYQKLLKGVKLQQEAKVKEEADIEERRIEKDRKRIEEEERIKVENEKLKAEAAEKDAEIEAERIREEARQKVRAEEKAKEDTDRKAKEAEGEAALQVEKEARLKAEADLKAREDAELEAAANSTQPTSDKGVIMQQVISAFEAGPLLPVEVPRDEYDRVMSYLVTVGFIESVVGDAMDLYIKEEETEEELV